MAPGRRGVIGDIHGAHKALVQCLERSAFDLQNDLLICLGDLCDRWPETNQVIETLLKVKNLVLLLGNHDEWALEWFLHKKAPDIWISQGGDATRHSYPTGVPQEHIALLREALLYYETDNRLFVHAGFDPKQAIEKQSQHVLLWDRNFIQSAFHYNRDGEPHHVTTYDEVYIGHTPTLNFGQTLPIHVCEVYLIDTGAGWMGGVLTIMDIDSKEYFQSDPVDQLYQDFNINKRY
jgi:serine/threonine protein phosphatase 1